MTKEQFAKEKAERQLSPAIADHYELEGILPGEVQVKGVTYDFRTIDKATADKLYEAGYKRLKPKANANTAAKAEKPALPAKG